ncbi:MAG: VWA domain-containing protein [Deltaproteobacteria bacterium]|nr:VWA domain-containing protein [Deltaproteobacteria bacterium]MBP7284981.1 VWA domain-containing protein [Nannocystaceae bacterium]
MRLSIGSILALSLGCGSASATGSGAGGNALSLQGGSDEAPAVFTARQHPPRVRPAPSPVDVASLPRLVNRTSQCFRDFADDEQPAIAKPRPRSKGKSRAASSTTKKSGFVPFSPGGGGSTPASGATPSAPAKPKAPPTGRASKAAKVADAAPAEDAAGASFEEAEARDIASPAPAMAPMTDADQGNAVTATRSNKRRDRRQKESSRRSQALAANTATPAPEPAAEPIAIAPADAFDDWGRATYLSNDDSMSLSSAQRVIFAIDRFLPLPLQHIRPHELLNYFSFATAPVAETDDFSVAAEIAADPDKPGIYNLALAVAGRPLDRESRRNTALTFVIDRSGSMADEGRMEFLKQGLRRMLDELKTGDMVHLVLFDDQVCSPIENFVVGRDSRSQLEAAIAQIQPRGSTDINLGLQSGYAIADRTFVTNASNRVVLVTDAIANTGVTDEEAISLIGHHYDTRRIRLSGIGVGTDFNDSLLDKLTERGHGAYVFLGSPAEVDAVFGARFVSLIETVANDVHFQLHLPPSLRMNVFYGEESSSVKEDIQAIHYFANTSQLFLSDLMARGGKLRTQDSVMLTVEYEDPETGDAMVEEFAFNLGEISNTEGARNVRKGRLLIHFIDGLAAMAARPLPNSWSNARESWQDPDAFASCDAGRNELRQMSSGLEGDAEVQRVTGLWDRYCSRFQRTSQAVRRASPEQGWPAATGR